MERFSKEKRMPLLIAKLEKPEALDNLDAILDEVARPTAGPSSSSRPRKCSSR
jgi:hypothetical protein